MLLLLVLLLGLLRIVGRLGKRWRRLELVERMREGSGVRWHAIGCYSNLGWRW